MENHGFWICRFNYIHKVKIFLTKEEALAFQSAFPSLNTGMQIAYFAYISKPHSFIKNYRSWIAHC